MTAAELAVPATPGRLADSDLLHSFRRAPLVMAAAAFCLVFLLVALAAPWIADSNPYDPRTFNLADSLLAPFWWTGDAPGYLLGTDDQGVGVLASILYGIRVSLLVGFLSVTLSVLIGVTAGLVSGYVGGWLDATIMRLADIQLTFPAMLVALLLGGVASSVLPHAARAALSIPVVILSLGIAHWPHFARLVRGATLVERGKEYVLAARLIGRGSMSIMLREVLPNVLNPVLVLATLDVAFVIIGEATLSFLGVGVPSSQPSLGTLIRFGYAHLFSGEWWIVLFPSVVLVALVVAVNVLGDWLRDALNPKLR